MENFQIHFHVIYFNILDKKNHENKTAKHYMDNDKMGSTKKIHFHNRAVVEMNSKLFQRREMTKK